MTPHKGHGPAAFFPSANATLLAFVMGVMLTMAVSFQGLAQPAAPGAPAAGQAEAGRNTDAALRETISGVLGSFRRFDDISVDVRSGFVILAGEVAAENDRAEAEAVAARFDGVIGIENDINVSLDIRDRGAEIYERLQDRLNDLLVSVPLFIIAAAIFLLFLAASRIVARRDDLLDRLTANPFQKQLLNQTIRVLIIVVGLILALEILDATSLIGAVLGAAGVTGIVLGFALKETIENYVAGLLLSLRQPFSPYDHIHVLDYEGHVIRLTSRATILMTLSGNHVRVPNADVFKSAVVNYSRNPERRFEFDIGIGVDVDLIAARTLAMETLSSMPGVLHEPEPDAWIEGLGDSNVVLKVLGWIDQREYSLPKVRGEAIRRVKTAFEAADFDLPEPIYRLKVMDKTDGTAGPAGNAPPRSGDPTTAPAPTEAADVDVRRDTHLEREVSRERAEMPDADLLTPDAQRE